jgi:Protein of unknown function DUF262
VNRKQNFQSIAWFNDIFSRGLLDLDPPYQRRSVWNQKFKDFFVDTILFDYPAPAIFLYEEISEDGTANYYVVDGKQRLTTIFEFVSNTFPIAESSESQGLHGLYFQDLSKERKREFWSYQFSVEYLPTNNEGTISKVFDRINRNTAKLSRQELRHAKLDGVFIDTCEKLSDWMFELLPDQFPRLTLQSRRQMKDIEFVASLLLFVEVGPKSFSADSLDVAFLDRDAEWDAHPQTEATFRQTIESLNQVVRLGHQSSLRTSRFRNQADFYTLFAALVLLERESRSPSTQTLHDKLVEFAAQVDDEAFRSTRNELQDYFDATRSASNDIGPRQRRIEIIMSLL